ncbi:PTS IIA-like nitrogen regulatory protein PtsN [Zooshikella ganghwensis]|nr:PTS IIA-like nitrogen regulatory protein PtsN [Zooshikella ganghwensis]
MTVYRAQEPVKLAIAGDCKNAMKLEQILAPECTACDVEGGSKKRTLEQIADILAGFRPGIGASELFDSLITRERLGSTGFGKGIALPHCRLTNCDKPMAALLKLREPIEFDAMDNHPVDLIFALVVPEEATSEHLAILQLVAERFENASFRNRLRNAQSNHELFELAIAPLPN